MCQQTWYRVLPKGFQAPSWYEHYRCLHSHPWSLLFSPMRSPLRSTNFISSSLPWFSSGLGFFQEFSFMCLAWKTPTMLQESQGISPAPVPLCMLDVLLVYSRRPVIFFFIAICFSFSLSFLSSSRGGCVCRAPYCGLSVCCGMGSW